MKIAKKRSKFAGESLKISFEKSSKKVVEGGREILPWVWRPVSSWKAISLPQPGNLGRDRNVTRKFPEILL